MRVVEVRGHYGSPYRVTIGHLRVTVGHPRVTIGYLRATMGHLISDYKESE